MKNHALTTIKITNLFLTGTIFVMWVFILGCKTTGVFSGTAPLTVIIVDENGQGINGFELKLNCAGETKRGITNSSGICVFENTQSGDIKVSGKKDGYLRLGNGSVNFTNKTDVFCFEIMSADFVFVQTEQLYECGNYDDAFLILDSLECGKKSELNAAVSFYKAYGYAHLNQIKQAEHELKKVKNASKTFYEKYSVAIEKIFLLTKTEEFE